MATVPEGEHGGQAGLQEKWTAGERPSRGREVSARQHKPRVVTFNVGGQPVGVRLRADQCKQSLGGNGLLAARTAIPQGQRLQAPTPAATDYLHAVPDRDGGGVLDLIRPGSGNGPGEGRAAE